MGGSGTVVTWKRCHDDTDRDNGRKLLSWLSSFALDLLKELAQRILGADVQVDLCGLEAVMAQDLLQRGRADAALDAVYRERVAKNVGRDGLGDKGAISDPPDDALGRSDRQSHVSIVDEVHFEQPLGACQQWHYSALVALAKSPALSPDDNAILLPLDMISTKAAQLADAQTRVEQSPDDELLSKLIARVDQSVGFLSAQRLTYELIGHDIALS